MMFDLVGKEIIIIYGSQGVVMRWFYMVISHRERTHTPTYNVQSGP
jgi:hypothetical protein